MQTLKKGSFITSLVIAVGIAMGAIIWYVTRISVVTRQIIVLSATPSFTIESSPTKTSVSATQEPTVDCTQLREYTNPRLELSFKYPACFRIEEPNPQYGQDSWIYIDYPHMSDTNLIYSSLITVSSGFLAKEKTFEQNADFFNERSTFSTAEFGQYDPIVKAKDRVTIGGKSGIRYTIYLKSTGETYYHLFLPWNTQRIHEIRVDANLGVEADKQADGILKTMIFK